MRRAVLGLVLLALAAPATAGAAKGYEFRLPAGAWVEAEPLALLAGRVEAPFHLDAFLLRADALRVYEGTRHYALVDAANDTHGLSLYGEERSYNLTNVTVRLLATSGKGHVGVHAREGSALAFRPLSALPLEGRNESLVAYGANSDATFHDENPDHSSSYYHAVEGPHLHGEAAGALVFRGSGRVHLFGPDVLLEADENRTRQSTGSAPRSTFFARSSETRWLVLESANLTLEAATRSPWELALAEARTDEAILRPDQAVLARASAPVPDAPDAGRGGGGAPFVLVALAVAGAGAAAAGLAVRRRRAAGPTDEAEAWEAEDCLRRANVHIEAGRPERALEWAEQARRLAPTSAEAASTLGFVMAQLGRVDDALEAYAAASRADPGSGEHDLHAARLMLRAGRPPGTARDLVERALSRTPALVVDLEEDPALGPLAASATLRPAIEAAWEAYGAELSSAQE